MRSSLATALTSLRHLGPKAVWYPLLLAVFPAMTLAIYRASGETGLYLLAVTIPVLVALAALMAGWQIDPPSADKTLSRRDVLETALDLSLGQTAESGRVPACVVLRIDDFDALVARMGSRGCAPILDQFQSRLSTALRSADTLARIDDASFAIALAPAARYDLETLLQISARLQAHIAEAVRLDHTSLRLSASVGFCVADRLPAPTGQRLLDAAEMAAVEARRHGGGSIRAYSRELHQRRETSLALIDDVTDALDRGEIYPWFQPQISTDTGKVTGFEALARWHHPKRGLISPAEFLPAIEQAGLMGRLGEVILSGALAAVVDWDKAGLNVPHVGVNFSGEELADPALVDRISWTLDRHDLTPDRLAIEILETVISETPEDTVCRNISGLANLGCLIDLDDFGTGHASITSIRRFAIGRLKIDRSFVSKVDQDPEQQRMVGAILTMAERLGLDCLAEGVETSGEHAMLSQLGCGHVQGFGLALPMPLEDTPDWLRRHAAAIARPPDLTRRIG
ncbi:diguanylate cyclase [Pseudoruegeria sp. SK021]|nr:diguanylate cyclase [Pseudoruegeria sp. SK021]